jgi:hypothetical protein
MGGACFLHLQGSPRRANVDAYTPIYTVSYPARFFFFFLSLNLSIGLQLSTWNCCKPFFPLLYHCQLLCFWRLALNIAVEVFPRRSFQILLLQGFE